MRASIAGLPCIALVLSSCGGTRHVAAPKDAGNGNAEATAPQAEAGPDVEAGGSGDAALHDARTSADVASEANEGSTTTDGGKTKYDSDGPVAYSMVALSATGSSDSFTENAYIPSTPGMHPVVSFSPGTQQPSIAYAAYATRLASWGFVVLLRDDPGVAVPTSTVVDDLTTVLTTWLPAQNTTSSSPLFGKMDLSRIGLSGHSRGGQATLLAIEAGLMGVVTWFGVDPVDIGFIAGPMAGPTLGTIGIPTGFIGGQVPTSCSPAAYNYEVLYAAAPSPSVAVTAVNASHTDFEDPNNCVACTICTPVGTADSQVVLAYSVRYLTAFFARELQGDKSVGAAFQGAGGPADVAAGLTQIVSK